MPELSSGLDYTKGPYYAVGDFGSVASTHVKLANDIPNQVSLAWGHARGLQRLRGGYCAPVGPRPLARRDLLWARRRTVHPPGRPLFTGKDIRRLR